MFAERKAYYRDLGRLRDSQVILYFLGDRKGGLGTQMHAEVLDRFVRHLDALPDYNGKISLVLYSRGGDTLAAWSIANLLRQYCVELEIIVPAKAHSAATLLCLSANCLLMTKQATLGPIDPSVNTPLNPGILGASPESRYSVSVEAIRGFIDLAKKEFGIERQEDLTQVLSRLVEHVHPLVLGEVYRVQKQINELADKLLGYHLSESSKKKEITKFLSKETGSHDYTISRNEASELGLPVKKPTSDEYIIIQNLYNDICVELELHVEFDRLTLLGQQPHQEYVAKRALIESLVGGSDCFMTEGTLSPANVQGKDGVFQDGVEDRKNFEGWRHFDE